MKEANDDGIDLSKILILTFENSAKNSMISKLNDISKNEVPVVSTIHSLSYSIIRENTNVRYKVMSSGEQYVGLSIIINGLKKKYPKEAYKLHSPFYYINLFSLYNLNARHHGTMKLDLMDTIVHDLYVKDKLEKNMIDFGDMIYYAYEILLVKKNLLQYKDRYKHIIVDEFQDMSYCQFEIIKLLSSNNNNMLVVGDHKQTLYAFSGASPKFIQGFKKMFDNAKVHTLDKTYRTPIKVLEIANLIALDLNDIKIETNSTNKSIIEVRKFRNQLEEAETIIDEITSNPDIDMTDTAILSRTNTGLMWFQSECIKRKIPFYSKGDTLLEGNAVKALIRYMKVIYGKHDAYDLKAIANIPTRFIATTKERFYKDLDKTINNAMRGNLRRFMRDLKSIRSAIKDNTTPEGMIKLVDILVHRFEIIKHFSIKGERDDKFIMNEIEAFRSFLDGMKSFDELIEINDFIYENKQNKSGLALLTMHSSKGLEYNDIYIIGMTSDMLPHRLTDDESEELRLFYVAVTRTKSNLTVSYPSFRDGKSKIASPFIKKYMSDYLEEEWI